MHHTLGVGFGEVRHPVGRMHCENASISAWLPPAMANCCPPALELPLDPEPPPGPELLPPDGSLPFVSRGLSRGGPEVGHGGVARAAPTCSQEQSAAPGQYNEQGDPPWF